MVTINVKYKIRIENRDEIELSNGSVKSDECISDGRKFKELNEIVILTYKAYSRAKINKLILND